MVITNIVVGVDQSEGARSALRWARDLVRAERAVGNRPTATMITAWSRPAIDTRAVLDNKTFEAAATATLEQLTEEELDGEPFEPVVRMGYPTFAIIDEANARDADLIVVGSRGRGTIAQVILGSTSRGVAAKADRPVAVIPNTANAGYTHDGPTVVGFDDSPGAKAAIRWAVDNLSGPIVALSAWQLPSPVVYDPGDPEVLEFHSNAEHALLAGLKETFGGTIDPRVQPLVKHEDPRLAILDQGLGASRVVLGARAERGFKGLLLGSTVTYVATHGELPVIIVPPLTETD